MRQSKRLYEGEILVLIKHIGIKCAAVTALLLSVATTGSIRAAVPQGAVQNSAARLVSPLEAARDPAMGAQVVSLLKQLTLEEKIRLLSGAAGMLTPAIPRLGIPSIKMSDGRVGVHDWGASTLFPATVALVAGWNPVFARAEGIAMGRDARARGVNLVLSPLVNLYREPQDGRNFEYMGEDPYLVSEIAVPYIRGMQSQGVAADVTDFCAYEQETNRMKVNCIVSRRALEELYFPPFKAAVRKAAYGRL